MSEGQYEAESSQRIEQVGLRANTLHEMGHGFILLNCSNAFNLIKHMKAFNVVVSGTLWQNATEHRWTFSAFFNPGNYQCIRTTTRVQGEDPTLFVTFLGTGLVGTRQQLAAGSVVIPAYRDLFHTDLLECPLTL